MGEVYRARDPRLGRDVAIKALPEGFERDPERVTRLEREARLLASLNHPNIAVLYGIEHVDGRLCLALELIEGESLADRLKRGSLPIEEAFEIVAQIATALEVAHEAGVVHRDLKPGNVMLRPDGVAKVLDFGLARGPAITGSSPDLTQSPTMTSPATVLGMILGTAAYMSPEQAKGRVADGRADVWAWGCVLYELLTGHRAFPGEDVSETLAAILKSEPDWDALPSGTPPRVRELLERCLRKDPRERLRDAGDARLLLAEARARGAEPGPVAVRKGPLTRLAQIAVAVVALLVGVLGTRLATRVPAQLPATLAITAPAGITLGSESVDFTISPDGRTVAFVGSDSLGTTRLWVRDLASDRARPLPGTEGAVQPFWSPDSRSLGCFTRGKLLTVTVASGALETLCDAPLARGGAWGKGFIVLQPRSLGPLMKIPDRGGELSATTVIDTAAGESGHRFPCFLPDGEHFIYSILPSKQNLHTLAVGSLAGSPGKPVGRALSGAVYAAPGYLLFAKQGAVRAQSFDARSLRVSGEETPVPGLRAVDPGSGGAPIVSASANGIVVQLAAQVVPLGLIWVDRTGRSLGELAVPEGRYARGQISPDGRRAAWEYAAGSDDPSAVWVLDLARQTMQRMTFEGEGFGPIWSPDGHEIAFTRQTKGRHSLWTMRADTPGSERLRHELPNLYNTPTDWTPDGLGIVHRTQGTESQQDIMLVSLADSAGDRPLLATRFNELHGTISPDGRWIAYLSDETGRLELYLRVFPSLEGQLRVSPAGAYADPTMWNRIGRPLWSRDGRELLYVAADGRTMLSVEVRPGSPLEFGTPQPLFRLPPGTADLCAAPGLDRFLLAVPREGQENPVATVLMNWPALLERAK
jgi:hypothetical protein